MMARSHLQVAFASLLVLTAVLGAFAAPIVARAADSEWKGEFFTNPYLVGAPTFTRDDQSINFDWGLGSPDARVPADSFSARWTRDLYLEAGRYRFTSEMDDGVRFYLNGQLLIDQWREQPATVYAVDREMVAGTHSLRVEYYESSGFAVARFAWTRLDSPAAPPADAWRGEYFAGTTLSGTPALVRADPGINFDWGSGPADSRVPADAFSVRWTRDLYLEAGRYRFSAEADDGVRLYVDGQLLIDQWHDQPATAYSAERDVSAGLHSVRMEYYDNRGLAVARLSWARAGGPVGDDYWTAQYYVNPSLTGSPAFTRLDRDLNFRWSTASPDPRLPADNFSVRWTRETYLAAGRYQFTAVADDGVRLWVDDRLLIDLWRDGGAARRSAEVDLAGGRHAIRLEYYERSGEALVSLSWELVSASEVGNIITCVRPTNSWIKVYRLDGAVWTDLSPRGWGPLDGSGHLKLDGMLVDSALYGDAGHPYRVELWANGSLVRSTGNTGRGEPEFRVRARIDNPTPWGCPAP